MPVAPRCGRKTGEEVFSEGPVAVGDGFVIALHPAERTLDLCSHCVAERWRRRGVSEVTEDERQTRVDGGDPREGGDARRFEADVTDRRHRGQDRI